MANKSVFASFLGRMLPTADARNMEQAPAYRLTPRHRLAQLAMTGTLNATFYADAEAQLAELLAAAAQVDAGFIARTAVYARRKGHMKDMPALLVALLSTLAAPEFPAAFRQVIDNGRMLRTFVQVMRSGVVGRKSLGTRPKKLVQAWLENASVAEVMRAAVGQDPSLADVVKMVHPRPADAARAALYAWLIDKPYDSAALPEPVAAFEAFKRDASLAVPDVPFQMLTARPLSKEQWAAIGRQAGWQMLRMNLNTFARHGVFEVEGFAGHVARRLRDPEAVKRARVFPYQLMSAYAMTEAGVPSAVREALQDAMETAIANVPALPGQVVVCPDVSGSMGSPITGQRKGSTSKVRCVDVAALVAAAVLRRNRTARVIPFEQAVVDIRLNPRDSVMTNAARLAAVGGGGTNCSAPLQQLAAEHAAVDLVVFVSDNQSWVDATSHPQRGTAMMRAWDAVKHRNPRARLVCIDLQPYGTTQAQERSDILNIGGFSDAVFDVLASFAQGELGAQHWVGEIEKVAL